ncbi:MAG TPA: hypothetical protein VFG39_07095 [Balneolaceae bacterium]|nr:hypothetical protein [Balneolaceae bacterium]
MKKEQLLEIEKGFWFEGADYYNTHITDEAVFVFPGMRLSKMTALREQITPRAGTNLI